MLTYCTVRWLDPAANPTAYRSSTHCIFVSLQEMRYCINDINGYITYCFLFARLLVFLFDSDSS